MTAMNDAQAARYADLLIQHGAGLRPNQPLYISGEVAHRELALRVAEAAYDHGASTVSFWLNDPQQMAQLIRRGRLEDIEVCHSREQTFLEEVVARRGAIISLRGHESPDLMPQIAREFPDRHAVYTRSSNRKGKVFLRHGVNRTLCPWVVAGAVTPGWARQVFPDAEPEAAVDLLWQQIYRFTCCDHPDAVERMSAKDRRLHARRRELNALQIREIRVQGGKTDLRVRFSALARWQGGSKQTIDGQTFNANVPSEENYTTPHRGGTEGLLAATMPFRTKSGLLVEGLVLEFSEGRVVHMEASRGEEGFRRWIDSDDGGRFLGEFALVGQDSPIAESGLFFEHTLFDENAWAHAALGQAYATALENGPKMSTRELQEAGCNASSIHTDIMFGSPEVDIIASDTREGEVALIQGGRWADRFLDPS